MLKGKSWWTLGAALLFIAVSGMGRDIAFESLLMLSSRQAYAVITKPHLQHDTCRYELQLENKLYNGTGYDCGHAPEGAYVDVYYWPANPGVASTLRPGDNLLTNLLVAVGILFVATLISIFRRPDD